MSDDEENIREKDEIYSDKLIDDEEEFIDDELMLALDLSKNDIYEMEYNNYLNNVIDSSIQDHFDNIKKKRKESLSLFIKKIEQLSYTKEDLEIKKYVMDVLNEYFNLTIDYVYVENPLYDKLYKIINTYYLIPLQKKYKKFGITYEEDIIVRSIFLLKN